MITQLLYQVFFCVHNSSWQDIIDMHTIALVPVNVIKYNLGFPPSF